VALAIIVLIGVVVFLVLYDAATAPEKFPPVASEPAPPGPCEGKTIAVGDFGAIPGDGIDDRAAIQSAIKSAVKGDCVALQPPGEYQHNDVLYISKSGIRFDMTGSTLTATHAKLQALFIQGNDITITGGKRIAPNTTARQGGPESSAIAGYFKDGSGKQQWIKNLRVYGVDIEHFGCNCVFLYQVEGALIQKNSCRRSWSDGVHMTAGTKRVIVEFNYVRENGDDMVAVVSYNYWATPTEDIIIRNNDTAGNYWGRGITVIGGRDVDIMDNRVAYTVNAGILISREGSYDTQGVKNVRAFRNTLDQIMTTQPKYNPKGEPAKFDSGHAGIDVFASLGSDQTRMDELAVTGIVLAGNKVTNSKNGAMRFNGGGGKTEVTFLPLGD
jgi:hypothetical protein